MMLQRYLLFHFFILVCCTVNGQTGWKLMKDHHGIQVFSGTAPNTKYKSIKVLCTLEGSLDQLIKILTNVDQHVDWVYKTKSTKLIKANTPTDLFYYSETIMPWPMENRDAVVHLVINRASLPHALHVLAKSEPQLMPKQTGKVRIPYSQAIWHVKAVGSNKIEVEYFFEVNPGGNLPPWIVNMFADKGPYESFRKLAELLKN